MKILFYDMGNFELDYFLDKIPSNIEPIFFKKPLNISTYVDEKHTGAEALSVFVSSDLSKDVLSKFKNLKYIFLRCVGFSNVDLNYCKENDHWYNDHCSGSKDATPVMLSAAFHQLCQSHLNGFCLC